MKTVRNSIPAFIFLIVLLVFTTVTFAGNNRCKCGKNEFTCNILAKCSCIPLKWKCDSEYDCEDFSDERDCEPAPCPDDWFRCANGQCIKIDWKCDGDNDCMDDSDEQDCPLQACDPMTQKTCDDGDCIPERWWCDEQEDCDDGSDEKSCEQEICSSSDFVCKTKECVAMSYRCDGEFHCRDGSDEEDCDDFTEHDVINVRNHSCHSDQFFCGWSQFPENDCIFQEFVCDGDQDCETGLDEQNCRFPCTSEQYSCDSGQCISLRSHCDGVDDCGDGSDEQNCEFAACIDGEFRCKDNLCISKNWRCDGDSDCNDGSDEEGCDKINENCSENQFECRDNHRCIISNWKCDGDTDCDDGSDELYCECSFREYLCHSGDCIPLDKLCNGVPDCEDGSDEQPFNPCNSSYVLGQNSSSCTYNNGGCEHKCKVTPTGKMQCVCKRGFRLAVDLRSCIDINECLVEGSCSQTCNNTFGSFTCSCLTGYELRPDGTTCRATGPAPTLLFTNRIDIRRMTPDRQDLKPILRDLENAIGLDYHIEKELVFWSDVTLDKIMRSNINGSDVKEVISSGLESPGGVAVDWIHDLLYWTDSRTSRIEVSQLNGGYRKVLIWQGLQKPRALALHPLKGLMFWTDWGKSPFLGCAAMDGSMKKSLASSNIYWPNGLAIDFTNDQIYWSDAKYHIIETANFDGEHRKPVISSGLPHPFGVTLFEDRVYWTDWQTKSVNSANKFTGNGVRTIRKQLHFPMDIRTYHPLRQPKGENKCANATCSHLCLPHPDGFTCACPTGYRTVNVTHCAEDIESFLVFTRKDDIRQISFDANERADIVLPLEGLKNAVALDFDSTLPGHLYWSDIGLDTINRCDWDGNNQKVLISSSLDSPAGIAVDWITNKIYWTDSGINRIEVAMLDGTMRCVLIWTSLDQPRAIVVYPKTGHMFWTDWGNPAKIEKSGMDGSDRKIIISASLKYPNGIAIDYSTERIYWADAGTKRIESSDLYGRNRKVIVTNLQHPFGLTLDKTNLYWTDWSDKSINFANKISGKNETVLRKELPHLMDIRYYHKSRPQITNPCSVMNGQCSHFCLLSPSSKRNDASPSYSCACPTGLVLGSDGSTCNTNMNKFLVIARRVDIRVISLDVDYSADVKLNIETYMTNVVDVAVDPVEGHLFWSDIGSNQICRSVLSNNPTNETVIIDSGLDTVDGIAVDVNGRLLYWTDDGKNTISVSTLNGKIRRILINDNLDSPRAIALHYGIGYMYWTDWGSNPSARIERAGMDGSNRSVIISSGLRWPNGLTIDQDLGWLIWGDAQNEKIEYSDLLGRNRRTLVTPVHHPYSLTTLDGFLYWTDWQTRNVEQLNIYNISEAKVTRENMPSLMGLKAVSMNVTISNVCGENNGGCNHLCLRSPLANIGYECACTTGVRIQEDGKSCNDLPSEYLLFTRRRSIQRVSLEADLNSPVELPIQNLENAIALDYHHNQQLLFFTDVYLDVIKRSRLDGSDVKVIISDRLKTMDGLAVDWIADNLYWTDAGLNTISVARMDGTSRKTLVDSGLDEPRAISVHPTSGLLFWTDWGSKPKIEKAFLDGSNRKVLVRKNLEWPNGLTIDYKGSVLYWVDARHLLNKIESCDFSGKRRKTIISPVPHGFAITFLDNTLYWTDWQTKNIHSATISAKTKRSIILKGVEELMGLKAVSASRQTGTNFCDSSRGYGGCPYLCLMRGSQKPVCVFPDQFNNTSESKKTSKVTSTSSVNEEINFSETTIPSRYTTTYPEIVTEETRKNSSTFMGLAAACVGTALVVFLLIVSTGLLIWKRCKRNRIPSPNISSTTTTITTSTCNNNNGVVSFHNLTYKANSNSTLTGQRSIQPTPTVSVRTLSVDEEERPEEEINLLSKSIKISADSSEEQMKKRNFFPPLDVVMVDCNDSDLNIIYKKKVISDNGSKKMKADDSCKIPKEWRGLGEKQLESPVHVYESIDELESDVNEDVDMIKESDALLQASSAIDSPRVNLSPSTAVTSSSRLSLSDSLNRENVLILDDNIAGDNFSRILSDLS